MMCERFEMSLIVPFRYNPSFYETIGTEGDAGLQPSGNIQQSRTFYREAAGVVSGHEGIGYSRGSFRSEGIRSLRAVLHGRIKRKTVGKE